MSYNNRENDGYGQSNKKLSRGVSKSAYEIRCDLIKLAIDAESVNLKSGDRLDAESIVKTAEIFNEFISKKSD